MQQGIEAPGLLEHRYTGPHSAAEMVRLMEAFRVLLKEGQIERGGIFTLPNRM